MWKTVTLGALALLLTASALRADETVSVETALSGLSYPAAVVIRPIEQPESYDLFVAESGAKRVVQVGSDALKDKTVVITNFPAASEADETEGNRNPRGLMFLDRSRLVASIAGSPMELRLYELEDDGESLAADQPKATVTLDPEMPNISDAGDRAGAMARTRANDEVADMLLLSTAAEARAARIHEFPIRASMVGAAVPVDDRQWSSIEGVPSALAVSDQGFFAVADRGEHAEHTQLLFMNPVSGQLVMRVDTKLEEISGVAFSPKSGNLYVAGRESEEDDGGVFRLDDLGGERSLPDRVEVTAVRIANAARPTALAFGPDNVLYVTVLGESSTGGTEDGSLLKLTGKL